MRRPNPRLRRPKEREGGWARPRAIQDRVEQASVVRRELRLRGILERSSERVQEGQERQPGDRQTTIVINSILPPKGRKKPLR